jgi:hypothetical protein
MLHNIINVENQLHVIFQEKAELEQLCTINPTRMSDLLYFQKIFWHSIGGTEDNYENIAII